MLAFGLEVNSGAVNDSDVATILPLSFSQIPSSTYKLVKLTI